MNISQDDYRNEDIELIKEGLKRLNIKSDCRKLSKLLKYMKLLLEENKKYNLTSITDKREIIIKHFFDSLSFLRFFSGNLEGTKVIDIGTGAGFPGLPLKICIEDFCLTLLEARKKRAYFCEKLSYLLNLDKVKIIQGRAEVYGHEPGFRDSFDFAFSRAVSELRVLIEYAVPFINEDGLFVAYKRGDITQEISESQRALEILNAEILKVEPVELSEYNLSGKLVFIKSFGSSPAEYPRRTGLPEKKPL